MARRGRRQQGRSEAGSAPAIAQLPKQQFVNNFAPVSAVSDDELEAIHQASLQILCEHGIEFELPEAREILRDAGADVKTGDTMVRFDPKLVMEHVAKSPSSFHLRARNPENDILIGDRNIVFSTVSSPPNISHTVRGRRAGTFEDFSGFLKIAQQVNVAQNISGHCVEPQDVAVNIRHLKATQAMLTLTDKTFRLYTHSRQRVIDVLDMVDIVMGPGSTDTVDARVFSSINPNSPRQYDASMLWGMIECARRGECLFVTPFTLAGAMAPASVAGALTLQNAEALAGIAFTQMVQPGTPVVYGGFTSNIDMKSGAPAFGTPEAVKSSLIGGQLARRYRLPYRASNANSSNACDAQAIYESQMSLWGSVLSGANYVYHALGWLEGGLAASVEKFVIDTEMVQGIVEAIKPVLINPQELAVEAIGGVKPGGHFLDSEHTLERYKTAFYSPFLSDWQNYEAWEEAGRQDALTRARDLGDRWLESWERPFMDADTQAALNEFVDRRVNEGGAPVS